MAEHVAIVGAGIVGIAHAWRESVHGACVTLFERNRRAECASVRNFGMVWPIGQAAENLDDALHSRSLWNEFAAETGTWLAPVGSLHLARREDERRVLEEFAEIGPKSGYACRLLKPERLRDMSPAASPDISAGLFSPSEATVDPRRAIRAAPEWLADRHGVKLEFETTITEVDRPWVRASDGRSWEFDRVTIASGADFATLYPEVFANNGLRKCKLQMLRTEAQPSSWRQGPMIASGLTLRHYANFEVCGSLPPLRERISQETPELDRYGIHVMASQNEAGEVVLGDSHEYGEAIEPFDKEEIEHLILRELRAILNLPNWEVSARWHGIYPVGEPGQIQFVLEPAEGVKIVLATGGCGMTMSFGLAERMVSGLRSADAPTATESVGGNSA